MIPEDSGPRPIVFKIDGKLKAALWWDAIRLLMAFMLGVFIGIGIALVAWGAP